MPIRLRAWLLRVMGFVEARGVTALREPQAKLWEGKLWELRALIDVPARAGLTQAELAGARGHHSVCDRAHGGGRVNSSLGMLRGYAEATGTRLRVMLERA